MFAALAATLVPSFISNLFASAGKAFEAYQNKQITLAQLQTQLTATGITEFAKVAASNADMVKATFGAFTQMVMSSWIVQGAYAFVVITQALVLLWVEVGAPFMVWKYGGTFPIPSIQLEWTYGLLVLMLGGGMVAIRTPKQPPIPKPEK